MRPKGILCLRLRTAYSGFRYSLLAHTYIFLSCKSSHEQRNLGRKKRKREKKIMRIKRDVVIIGSGPVGLLSGLFLSKYKIPHLIIEK